MAFDYEDAGTFGSEREAKDWALRNKIDLRDLHIRNAGGQRVEVIPHEPDTGQARLFILLIDGSGSMREMGGRKASRIEVTRQIRTDPTAPFPLPRPGIAERL